MKINHHKNFTEIEKLIGGVNNVAFSRNGDTFNLNDKLQIQVSESNQYINFTFTAIINIPKDIYADSIVETFSVSKFEIAEHYKLNSPTSLSNISFYLYIKGRNAFKNTIYRTAEFNVENAILEDILPFERYSSSKFGITEVLILDIPAIISKIIETSIWELINQK